MQLLNKLQPRTSKAKADMALSGLQRELRASSWDDTRASLMPRDECVEDLLDTLEFTTALLASAVVRLNGKP